MQGGVLGLVQPSYEGRGGGGGGGGCTSGWDWGGG
jgi:hypothetical protein